MGLTCVGNPGKMIVSVASKNMAMTLSMIDIIVHFKDNVDDAAFFPIMIMICPATGNWLGT
jgi:hypothetical protein